MTPVCGDGIPQSPEACDDNNLNPGDGCSPTCTIDVGFACNGMPSICTTTCGDGIKAGTEGCDDAPPAENGDGCSATCTVEPNYMCMGTMPSVCIPLPSCMDGIKNGNETDVDCGGTCAPANRCATGQMCAVGGDCVNAVCTGMSCAAPACGNGIVQTGEACDDNNIATGDGCTAACTVEPGFACAGSPSLCTTTCGDGIKAGTEGCDDAPPAENGDGCSATCTVEAGYTCTGSPSVCSASCGNGVKDPSEQCDDGNMVAGDGCSAACTFDLGCAAGETQVVTNVTTPLAIPDSPAPAVSSVVNLGSSAAVTKLSIYIASLTHTFDGDLDISLVGPNGVSRDISSDNGSTADNYLNTQFIDGAPTSITAGTAPFSGRFAPEQSMATTAGTDLRNLNAAAPWSLVILDDSGGDTGTLDAWSLIACVNPAIPYCGNGTIEAGEQCDDGNVNNTDACDNRCRFNGCGDGNIDPGEQCDDANMASGDGCSSTCQVENPCPAGQTAVSVNGAGMIAIPDADAGISSAATVVTVGAITRLRVLTNFTHPNDTDLDVFLLGPNGVQRELTTDNGGSGDNFSGTLFADSAALAITSGSAPFSGSFRPELSLTTTAGTDFLSSRAIGTWTLLAADDATTQTGTLDSWTLFACVDPAGPYCGDGMTNLTFEECDDGNAVNTDVCTNTCQLGDGCGDGNLDPGEQCDDDNTRNGDGCSSTCAFEMACAVGQTMSVLTNTTSAAIPDNNMGMQSFISVPTSGLVRQVRALINVTHALDTHLDIFLRAPHSVQRELSTDNGGGGANYVGTMFADDAGVAITSGVSPFSGAFRPEQTLNTGGFAGQEAQGAWALRIGDDTVGTTGTLNSWALALCIDPILPAVCGNGAVETGETCDDANVGNGDGCSSLCQVEITCGTGETLVLVSSTDVPKLIPDNSMTGVTSTVSVAATGTVRKAIVVVGTLTHTFDGDIAISLISPMPTTVALVTNRGSTGDDFVSTLLDDSATTAISAGTAPFRGRFQPEAVLSGFNGQAAAGTWTLKMTDNANADVGELVSWTLGLCVQ